MSIDFGRFCLMVSLAKPLAVEFSTWIGVAIVGGKLHSFGDAFCAGTWNVDVVTLVVVRGRSKVTSINTVRGPGAAVVRCLMHDDSRAWRC